MAQNDGARSQSDDLIRATREAAAASLAGGIIAASGRPHSPEQAKAVFNDVFWTLFPSPSNGDFNLWQAAKRDTVEQGYHKNEYEA